MILNLYPTALNHEIHCDFADLTGGSDLPGRLGVHLDHLQHFTVYSNAHKSICSTFMDFIYLAIHFFYFVAEIASSVAKIIEIEPTL